MWVPASLLSACSHTESWVSSLLPTHYMPAPPPPDYQQGFCTSLPPGDGLILSVIRHALLHIPSNLVSKWCTEPPSALVGALQSVLRKYLSREWARGRLLPASNQTLPACTFVLFHTVSFEGLNKKKKVHRNPLSFVVGISRLSQSTLNSLTGPHHQWPLSCRTCWISAQTTWVLLVLSKVNSRVTGVSHHAVSLEFQAEAEARCCATILPHPPG